jgi:hypothetical protein
MSVNPGLIPSGEATMVPVLSGFAKAFIILIYFKIFEQFG